MVEVAPAATAPAEPAPEPAPAAEPDMQLTDSGLGIVDLKIGEGPEARAGMQVTVHYVGKLADGRMFDSSRERGRPFRFELGGGMVIPGWDEGVVGMRVGGLRRLIIPPQLGYGERGQPPIPPNAILEFEIELLAVEAAPDEDAPASIE
jgi:FKBP-type peptidyl-prolyl cis-trans isomerase FkpA